MHGFFKELKTHGHEVDIAFVELFFAANFFTLKKESVLKVIDGKGLPSNTDEPEFIFRLIDVPPKSMQDMMMSQGRPIKGIGVEYEGIVYDSTIPRPLFNYMCHLMCKESPILYKNLEELEAKLLSTQKETQVKVPKVKFKVDEKGNISKKEESLKKVEEPKDIGSLQDFLNNFKPG